MREVLRLFGKKRVVPPPGIILMLTQVRLPSHSENLLRQFRLRRHHRRQVGFLQLPLRPQHHHNTDRATKQAKK